MMAVCDQIRESIMILLIMGLNSDHFSDQPFKPQNEYTHFGKVSELIDGRFVTYRPTRKCLGPNHNLLRARTGNRTGKRPPARA